jgi:hypothetical protein
MSIDFPFHHQADTVVKNLVTGSDKMLLFENKTQ